MRRDRQTKAMMTAFRNEMRAHFGNRWHEVVGKTPEEEEIALMSWQAAFRRRGMKWGQVLEVIDACTSENCPWPTRVEFFGVWEKLNATAMGHASFRPAHEVLNQHAGTERAALPKPKSEDDEARNRAIGRATFDALKASF